MIRTCRSSPSKDRSLEYVEKKRALAKAITDATEAFGLPPSTVVVIMHENSSECVSSGGELICDGEETRP